MAVVSSLRTRLDHDGYVIVPDVVPAELIAAVVEDIWQHTGARPGDRASWYKADLISIHGMVEMYHYQSLWNTRQYPRVHEIFAEIHGTDRLWVSLDRTNLKPPADPAYPEHNSQGFIHWDVDTLPYPSIPFRLQGVLALVDTDEAMGGFQGIPELFRDLPHWIPGQPGDRDPRRPDISGYSITSIPLKAGDMVIWSTLLPHGNGHNVSSKARLAQYITMNPAEEENEELRQTRIQCWRERRPIPARAFRGDPRSIEQEFGQPPVLSSLGRKLLGVDLWQVNTGLPRPVAVGDGQSGHH